MSAHSKTVQIITLLVAVNMTSHVHPSQVNSPKAALISRGADRKRKIFYCASSAHNNAQRVMTEGSNPFWAAFTALVRCE